MDVDKIDHCEIMGVDGTHALFINGQFCIPIDSHADFFPGSDTDYVNTLNDVDYLNNDDSGMIFCIDNAGVEASEDHNIIYYSNEEEPTIKLQDAQYEFVDDNGIPLKTLTLDEGSINVDSFLDNTSDLHQINENFGLSGFQYIVQLNDFLDGEDTQDSFLCNDLQTQNIEENLTNEQLDFIDISQLQGTNRLTGQTVSLTVKDSNDISLKTEITENIRYTNQQNALNNLLNKKLTIGKTTNGRRLVGKIIHVGRKGDSTRNETNSDLTKNQMLSSVIKKKNLDELSTLRETQCINENSHKKTDLSVYNGVDGNVAEYISRILTSLMGMESVSKKLQKKNLLINIIEKMTGSDKIKTNMLEVQGHLELRRASRIEGFTNKWVFKMNKDSDNTKHGIWCPSRNHRKFQETMKLTTTIEQTNGIIQSAKVNVNLHQEKCSICSEEFKSLSYLKFHLKQVHHMLDDHFSCPLCEQPHSPDVLKELVNKKSFGCTKCNKQYNTERNLSKHMLASHDSDNWKLACKICGEEYNRMSLWRKHMLTHTTLKMDDKEYFTYGDISYHSRMNDSKSCYICKVCNRTFSKYSNLQRHSEIHGKKNSIAVFSCSMCGCTYNYISSLTRHIVQNHLTVP